MMTMRASLRAFLPVLASAALCGALLRAAETNVADGWTVLFNGKDTSGWRNPYEWGTVEVKDGEIHLTADKKFFLVTERNFGDFEFEGEILLPEGKANSGFMFRCHVEPNKVFGYQAEVDGSDRKWSGGLYDEGRRGWIHPAKDPKSSGTEFADGPGQAFKRNDWNRYRIVCQGNRLQIFVNGVQTTDLTDDTDAEGPIGIQHHGEKGQTYRFRNLRIRELHASGN